MNIRDMIVQGSPDWSMNALFSLLSSFRIIFLFIENRLAFLLLHLPIRIPHLSVLLLLSILCVLSSPRFLVYSCPSPLTPIFMFHVLTPDLFLSASSSVLSCYPHIHSSMQA